MLDLETIKKLPKVALHDHLDGGLRPQTVIDLAAEVGHELPTTDAEELGNWFFEAADSGSLERYLETFAHTVAVMQSAPALRRVAKEFVEDQAADGVVYAEARWAPEQHLERGLTMAQAIEAVRDGIGEGMVSAGFGGAQIHVQQLVTGMRHTARSAEVAELAVAYHSDSVAGFDIAGPEAGFPPSRHLEAFNYLRRNNMRYTIHAGEAAGPESIWEAVQLCGANRLGHGVRLVEDIQRDEAGEWRLGELAAYVRDQRIPLEVCPSSNLQTGIAPAYASHPIGVLTALEFRVTVSCDNRLMSRTTLSREFHELTKAFGYHLGDLGWFTCNAAKSAFLPHDARVRLINEVILPAFAAAA